MPKVSVIMPVFNTPEVFLRQAINSILGQTLTDIELIVVNDGSEKVDIESIISTIKDKRLHYVYQNNSGAGIARNLGMTKAHGDYLYFMDSDDRLDSEALEELSCLADKQKSDVVYFNLDKTPETGMQKISEFHFNLTSPSACTKLFRRSFVQKYRIQFESLRSCNDLTFTFTALTLAKNIWKINKSYYFYNQENPNSISKTRGKNSLCLIGAMKALRKNMQANNVFEKYESEYNDCYVNCARYELEFKTNDRKGFLSEIKKDNKIVYKRLTHRKWFGKEKCPNGYRYFYLFGIKVLSYQHKKGK